MSQNVTQWLEEIKALRQQLAEAERERAAAYASAANWQRLYETEAQQRRVEATLAKQTIAVLQQEVQALKGFGLSNVSKTDEDIDNATIQTAVARFNEMELRSHLIQALTDCDRLGKALETEQTHHVQTRTSLTTALGDAIDALSKARKDEG